MKPFWFFFLVQSQNLSRRFLWVFFFSFSFLLDAGKTLLVWFLMSCQLSKHIPVQLFTHGRNYTTAHHVMPVCTILWWNPTLNPPPPHKSFQIDTSPAVCRLPWTCDQQRPEQCDAVLLTQVENPLEDVLLIEWCLQSGCTAGAWSRSEYWPSHSGRGLLMTQPEELIHLSPMPDQRWIGTVEH